MKRFALSISVLFSVSQIAGAAGAAEAAGPGEAETGGGKEKTILIKVTDRSEYVTFELMAPADFKQLQKQLSLEEKLHVKVMAATEKAWREDESTKKKSFPRGSIVLRKAVIVKEFTDAAKASDALAREEEKLADRMKWEKEKAEKREKDSAGKKSRTKDQLEKDKKRDAERDSVIAEAKNLYESKLQELMTPTEGGNEAAQEASKPGNKKEEPKEAGKKAP